MKEEQDVHPGNTLCTGEPTHLVDGFQENFHVLHIFTGEERVKNGLLLLFGKLSRASFGGCSFVLV